ncbi:MAG TPA: hypothetical protein VG890_10195 [Puia sp.]|nr:hypothetical protein [Puia sp.]
MQWNALITNSQYRNSLKRMEELSGALPGTPEKDELDLLLLLVRDFEKRQAEHSPVFHPSPGVLPSH